jgi:hypothetical protein
MGPSRSGSGSPVDRIKPDWQVQLSVIEITDGGGGERPGDGGIVVEP